MAKQIKFRSPTDEVLHVASTSGHAARIGPEWRELPAILHKAAIAEGAITSNMSKEAIEAVLQSASKPFDSREAIKGAIKAMLEEDDQQENFTTAGLPNLKKLSERCGFNVDREVMQEVWKEVEAEAGDAGNTQD